MVTRESIKNFRTADKWEVGNPLIHTNMRKFKGDQIYPFDALNDPNLSVIFFIPSLPIKIQFLGPKSPKKGQMRQPDKF